MNLTISTPLTVVLDREPVRHVRAEDASGAFGILSGHADFLTALSLCVVTWRGSDDSEHHAAVRGGLLEVRNGAEVTIATREAVRDDNLDRLEHAVLQSFRQRVEQERAARTGSERLYLAALNQIYRLLRPAAAKLPGGSSSPTEFGT